MQKPFSRYLLLGLTLALIAAVLSAGCVFASAKPYVVGVESSANPPHIIYSESGELSGFDVEAIRWIAEQEGFTVTFKPVAWNNIIPSLQAGKIDVIFSAMTVTDERSKLVAFTDPYWYVNQGVAVRNDSLWDMEDFLSKEMRVAFQRGTTAQTYIKEIWGEEYSHQFYTRKLILCSTFDEMIQTVADGAADCCITDDTTLLSYIRGDASLVMLGTIPVGETYGAAVREEDTTLLHLMNEGIAKFANSTKREELVAKYF